MKLMLWLSDAMFDSKLHSNHVIITSLDNYLGLEVFDMTDIGGRGDTTSLASARLFVRTSMHSKNDFDFGNARFNACLQNSSKSTRLPLSNS